MVATGDVDWSPCPSRTGASTVIGDYAKENRQWIEKHPIVCDSDGRVLLLRFVDDVQLTAVLAALLLRYPGKTIAAIGVTQYPHLGRVVGMTATWLVEGKVIVCLD